MIKLRLSKVNKIILKTMTIIMSYKYSSKRIYLESSSKRKKKVPNAKQIGY